MNDTNAQKRKTIPSHSSTFQNTPRSENKNWTIPPGFNGSISPASLVNRTIYDATGKLAPALASTWFADRECSISKTELSASLSAIRYILTLTSRCYFVLSFASMRVEHNFPSSTRFISS